MSSGPTNAETAAGKNAGGFSRIMEDALFSGMIGAVAVAVWFLILDAIDGRPLYTPSLLGKVFFQRPDALTDLTIDPTMVVVFTGVHMVVFFLIGLGSAYMVAASEKTPAMGILLLFLFIIIQTIFLTYCFAIGVQLLGTLRTWAVVVANILAAGGMSFYFLKRRPGAAASIGRSLEET